MVYVRQSSCESGQPCGTPVTMEELLKSLFIRNTETGCVYINANVNTSATCVGYEPAISCGTTAELLQLLSMAISIDTCGNPSLNLIYFTELT